MGKRKSTRGNWSEPQAVSTPPADPFADNGSAVATAAPPKKRGRPPKQKFFEGTEPVTIKELEEAAEAYVGIRDQRMELTKQEVEHKKLLAELMKKHKLETYAFDGQMIEYTHVDEDQVKVKKVRAAQESPQSTGDEG